MNTPNQLTTAVTKSDEQMETHEKNEYRSIISLIFRVLHNTLIVYIGYDR